jgi:hypothetical protein
MSDPIKTVTLSDGRVATVRRPKGRDMEEAERAGGESKTGYLFAFIARTTTIDGKPIVLEDVRELYASDIDLLSKAAGADFLSASTAPSTSPSSSAASASTS